MKKFEQLTAYIHGLGIQRNKVDQWAENVKLTIRGRYDGKKVLLHTMEYRAVFSIERFDYRKCSFEMLSALLSVWLSENDDRSELPDPDPQTDITLLDDGTANLEITVEFEEDVYLTESENGVIEYAGKKWLLEDSAHDIAENATVIASYG